MAEQAPRGFFDHRPHAVPAIAASALLLGALARWPYGYYVFLRWVTCVAAVAVAAVAYSLRLVWAVWLFALVALLFNPLIPVHLTRSIWRPIDVIVAVLFLGSLLLLCSPGSQEAAPGDQVDNVDSVDPP
jgi:hypothetical protein